MVPTANRLASALLLLASACVEHESIAPGHDTGEEDLTEDGPCATTEEHCRSDGLRFTCEHGVWVVTNCAERCGSPDGVCKEGSLGSARCECPVTPPGSVWPDPQPGPPQDSCLDANTLQQCRGAEGCSTTECTDVCAAQSQTSLGCSDALGVCYCSEVGTPCPDGAEPRCDGPTHLATCVDGQWALQVCASECDAAQTPVCRLADDGTSGCTCAEVP